ncbi:MAG: hypothetical protein F6K42_34145 [Leptolyngbya sp. SIO1D8]|nr:hypothetical protein [Leptolyngbya sp. SIO1D8]
MNPSDPPLWEPSTRASAPTGLMAPIQIQSHRDELPQLSAIANAILDDPLQVQQLAERVYQLMQEDLQLQHERGGFYGGRR